MSHVTYKGKLISINKPAEAVAWGFRESGAGRPQLTLALRKRGEHPIETIKRVSARHPGVDFNEFTDGAMFDGTAEFGVPDGSPGELNFDLIETADGGLAFAFNDRISAQALTTTMYDENDALSRLLARQAALEEEDRRRLEGKS